LAEDIFWIRGKVAPITGGYRGIGATIALGFAGMGARIAVTGVEGAQAASFATSLRNRGHDAYSAQFDAVSAATHRMVVASTVVNTEMSAHMLADKAFHSALVSLIPPGRTVEPEDVMRTPLFFALPASDFITGQILNVGCGIAATR
jgi:NAD(P)-dependent dehydrogenase (short-subunit alcohol dehydrogenase family)